MKNDLLKWIGDFIYVEDAPRMADAIFIPGCSSPRPALRAAALYGAGFARTIVPSGRFALSAERFPGTAEDKERYAGPYESEAAFMRDVLRQSGVPEIAILLEEQARYTWQNAQLSRRVTDAEGLKICTGLICCKPYHARRCLMYYQAAFPEANFFVCPARGYPLTKENWHTTAEGISRTLGELERCGSQFHEILKELCL